MNNFQSNLLDFWNINLSKLLILDKYPKSSDKILSKENGINGIWFGEERINVYKNLISKHLDFKANKNAIISIKDNHIEKFTYGQLDDLVNKALNELDKFDFFYRKRILVISSSGIEAAIIFLLSCKRVCTHCCLFTTLSPNSIADRIKVFEPDLIFFTNHQILKEFEVSIKRFNIPIFLIKVNQKEVSICKINKYEKTNSINKLIKDESIYFGKDALFCLFTSGSTGKPKGIVHSSIGYLLYAVYTSKYFFNLNQESTMFCGSDAGWINGHTYAFYGPLLMGSTTVLIDKPSDLSNPKKLDNYLKETYSSILYLPVTTVRILKELSRNYSFKNKSLIKAIGTMGEMLAPSVEKWFSETFSINNNLPVINTYFQTETGGIMVAKTFRDKPGIINGEIGEIPKIVKIYLSNDGLIISGYWPGFMIDILGLKKEEAQLKYLKHKDFKLNDDGSVNKGKLFVNGRIDDLINYKGQRISSGEIESCLLESKFISEVAAVSYMNDMDIEDICLFIVVSNQYSDKILEKSYDLLLTILEDCRDLVKTQLGKYLSIGKIKFIGIMPKTKSGKILRRFLKEHNTIKTIKLTSEELKQKYSTATDLNYLINFKIISEI